MNPIRPIRSEDRAASFGFALEHRRISPHELAVAMELVDTALNETRAAGLSAFRARSGRQNRRLRVLRAKPMTRFTYDLYWIATRADSCARVTAGRCCICEDEVRARGGRLLVIETSSKES